MELLIGAAVLALIWAIAPLIALAQKHTAGLGAVQTLCAIGGVILVVVWYAVDRPDAARLKFDQAVTTAPLPGHRVLVVTELTIANVGGHEAKFHDWPYYVLIQRVTPPDPAVAQALAPPARGYPRLQDANNWGPGGVLAYRMAGQDMGDWKQTAEGFEGEIAPSETDNFYFRAAVPCAEGLHISVSSRIRKPRGPWRVLTGAKPLVWIKQSFVDLTDLCKAETEPK